jgi:hypothetical protein
MKPNCSIITAITPIEIASVVLILLTKLLNNRDALDLHELNIISVLADASLSVPLD